MSDTYKYGDIKLDSREKKIPNTREREAEGFEELKAHLADFKRRMLKASSLDEPIEIDYESID